MKLTVRNFGTLDEVTIEPRPLTLFCGGNNTGKTYVTYLLWGLFKRRLPFQLPFTGALVEQLGQQSVVRVDFPALIEDHLADLQVSAARRLKGQLTELFATAPERFAAAEIRLELDKGILRERLKAAVISEAVGGSTAPLLDFRKEADSRELAITLMHAALPASLQRDIVDSVLSRVALVDLPDDTLLLPAERSGLNLFFRELDSRSRLDRESASPTMASGLFKYPAPIDAYIQLLKEQPYLKRQTSPLRELARWLSGQVLQGSYDVGEAGEILVVPDGGTGGPLDFHLGSSTLKTFFGLWSYLSYSARPGDCLMIDEPELNLHPDNQRRVARLLARLVNRGVRVLVSTHSDYIVREISNLLMLSEDFAGRDGLVAEFGYERDGCEFLRTDQVAALAP